VVGRRYGRLLKENKEFPDLIIIDGGKGQLGAACEALAELNVVGQEIVGLAKKQEEVYFPGQSAPRLLSRRSEALFLLQRTRDEAHRFAITFHRKLRAKRSLLSNFDKLEGIGPARRKMLLTHFESWDKFVAAPLSEIQTLLPKNIAKKVFDSVHPELPLPNQEQDTETKAPEDNADVKLSI
jgi:excinuclease ABC subunit C